MTIKLLRNLCIHETLENSISTAAVVAEHCHSKGNSSEDKSTSMSKSEKGTKIPCLDLQMLNLPYIMWQKVCSFLTIKIRSNDVQLSSNFSGVTGLDFHENKKILYLPVGLQQVFPSLYVLDAISCSVVELSKANFQGLKQLSYLWLRDNQIEFIESGTFRDLDSLVDLDLSENFLFFQFYKL
jgi:Leucine-rich repeat (LRR) protein